MFENNKKLHRKAFATFLGFLLCAGPISAKVAELPISNVVKVASQEKYNPHKEWTKIYSFHGNFNATFPRQPDHVKQNMQVKGEARDLEYDVYVADLDRKSVFMVLSAKYPSEVPQEHTVSSLEHFLNSILVQNPNNQLVFADLVDVQGHQAMDFFIRTQSPSSPSTVIYFKGRVLLAKNYLYLLAMECEQKNYEDIHYKYFIDSFELVK